MVADENSISEDQEWAKKYMSKSPQKGDIWNVVSSKWFKKWTSYIHITDSIVTHNSDGDRSNPGPIDNSDIVEDGVLKTNLLEPDDYRLIPKELFTYLRKKYDIVSHEQILERKVIEIKTARGEKYQVEVYLLKLKLRVLGSTGPSKEMEFSKEMTVAEMSKRVATEFRISDAIRFIIKCNDEYVKIPGNSTLGEEFQMNQEVFVDIKKDEMWQHDVKMGRENGATAAVTPSGSSAFSGNHYSAGGSAYNDKPTGLYGKGPSHSRGMAMSYGLRGLNNLGNTCFMNSAIQSLSNVPPLTKFFQSGLWQRQLNVKNPLGMDGEIACSYAELIDNLWSGQNTPFMPRRFKMAVGRFAPQFSGFQQQDAQELMAFLLDGLHEDLNRIKKKPYVEVKDSDGRPDEIVANESWDNYRKRNDSIIVDLFHGQLRSELVCPECNRISVTFDPFCYLSLPMPAEETTVTVTLYRCMSSLESKPKKYSFRAFADIPYREFLKRLRKVADLPAQTELILGESAQHSSVSPRIFPPSSESSDHERIPSSPMPEHSGYHHRSQTNFVAFEVPRRSSSDTLVWIEITYGGHQYLRPLLLILKRSDGGSYPDRKEEMLFAELATKVYPYVSSEYLTESIGKLSKSSKRMENDDVDDEDREDQTSMELDVEAEADKNYQWSDLTEHQKAEIGRMWFTLDNRYTGASSFVSKIVDQKSVRIPNKDLFSKLFTETIEHSSVSDMKGHGRGVQLTNCLDLFTKKETLGERDSWYCNKCKKHQRATKQFDLWKLPEVLVIHLKRFGNAHRLWRNKLNTKVFFPLKGFKLNQWQKNKNHENFSYNLVSVVNHFGSMGGGHYTANAWNHKDESWYNFDDSSVTRISAEHVVSQNAYVLVYVREESLSQRDGQDLMDTD